MNRDTRLLALVILIALGVLVVLARFRFPDRDTRPAVVAPNPLERLAARATYEDLAAAVQSALQRVSPSVVMFEVESEGERHRRVGVRIRPDAAIVQVPPGLRVAAPVSPSTVRSFDPLRDAAMVTLPAGDGSERAATPAGDFGGFAYVAVVEPASGGPTATPVFIGRVDTAPDERWGGNVLVPGGSPALPDGALVFLLDGRFIGLVIAQPDGARAIVPAAVIDAAIGKLPGDGGVR